MADTSRTRSKIRVSKETQGSEGNSEIINDNSNRGWPARPKQEQYEWEEPRVVADSKFKGLEGQRDHKTKKHRENKRVQLGAENGGNFNTRETQSELGGTDDGIASGVDSITNRVDRLRLLGNGVVPQMCERAIRVLLKKLHNVG